MMFLATNWWVFGIVSVFFLIIAVTFQLLTMKNLMTENIKDSFKSSVKQMIPIMISWILFCVLAITTLIGFVLAVILFLKS